MWRNGLKIVSEDVTEELEYVPGRFIVNRIVRPSHGLLGLARPLRNRLCRRVPIETRYAPGPGLVGPCAGLKICGSFAVLPAISNLRPRRRIDLDRSTMASNVYV